MVNKIKLTGILIWLGFCSLYAQQTLWARQQEKESIYSIQDSVMIRTRDGAEISAMVVRKKNDNVLRPVILHLQSMYGIRDAICSRLKKLQIGDM
jgi:predicted acyl esterase